MSPSEGSISRLPKVGVIGLVPDSWGGPWQIRHQILTRLGSHFEVLWVEESPGWRELWTDPDVRRWAVGFKPGERKGFSVYKPDKWLPRVYNPRFLGDALLRLRMRRARRFLEERGCRTIVLYLWRPGHAMAMDMVPHDFSCYHIDDEYTFSETEIPIDPAEAALIKRVDQVFICAKAMLEKKGGLNPNTMIVTNGVNYKAYTSPWQEPEDLRNIPHPRIGYVGILKKQMDLGLLLNLARMHPEWSIVLVGPKGVLGESAPVMVALEALPNVHLTGGKPVDQLPAYTQYLDVCLLCYKMDGYTKFIYPLKLHEYLASGHPVVGTPIHSLKEFSGAIRLASTVEEWSRAISESLAENSEPSRAEERRSIAKRFDWEVLTGTVAAAIRDGLSRKRALGISLVATLRLAFDSTTI